MWDLSSCESGHSDQIGFRMVIVHLYIYYALYIYVIAYKLKLFCLGKAIRITLQPPRLEPI